jgi:uncharacterized MnhB-related membrane protein
MKKLIILIICILIPSKSFAVIHPKDQAKIIFYSGIYGAVLGLSTLSFYDKPSSRTRNIAMGAALGLMASVVITTIVATKEGKKKIQESLINEPETNIIEPTVEEQKKDNTNRKRTAPLKKDSKKEEDFFRDFDFDYDDEDDDYFDDDYFMYNKINSFDILFASFNNNKLAFNNNFLSFYQNEHNNKIDVYTNIINIRF